MEGFIMAKNVKELVEEVESFYLNVMMDQGSYLDFLDTMAKFHKYDLREQINIFHNASENSTVLANEEIWKRLNRTLKTNANAIPVLKGENGQERIEYVYDVSDTNEYRENEELLWHIDEERDKEYLNAALQGEGSVENRVRHICMQMAGGFEGSEEEKNILGLSLSYVTLKRMGYDTSDISMELISTPWDLENPEKLLTEVNISAKSILNPLGSYIRNGRTKQNDRSGLYNVTNTADNGRAGAGGRNGGLGTGGVLRTMGEDQDAISDRGKERDVEETSGRGESGEVSDGLSGEVRPEIRPTERNDDGEGRGNGGTESGKSRGVDSQGELRQTSGNGNDNSGNQRNDVENQNENNTTPNSAHNLVFQTVDRFSPIENRTYYDAIPSDDITDDILKTLDTMPTTYPKTFINVGYGKAFFSFENPQDRDAFIVEARSFINAEENSVQNKQDSESEQEQDEYIYFTREGKFGRERINNNDPTRNRENIYKVAAELGATIISKEEYEKGLAEQRSQIATDRMKELFREDNIEKIFDILSVNDNTYSIKAFSELSGIFLDRTWKRRKQQLIEYYGEKYTKWQEELETAAREKEQREKEAEEAELKEESAKIGDKYYDYIKNISPMQRARINKILGTMLRYDNKIQTRAQNMESLFSDGKLAFTYNDYGKTKYAVESFRTGSFYDITKTEFDYWHYLYENSNVNIKPQHFSRYSHKADEQYAEYHFAYIPEDQASARYWVSADLNELSKKYLGHSMAAAVDGIQGHGFSFSTAENMNSFVEEANAYLDQQYGATTSYDESLSLLAEDEVAREEKVENTVGNNDSVFDYNEMVDKIDNILRGYGEQKIKLAEALQQLENININENVNRNIFITDRITKVSGFLKDTQKEIDDILAGYEKTEYEYAEAFRRFQSLELAIINKNGQFENISDMMAESGKNAAENSLNIIRAEHEKQFEEQVAEAERINREREESEQSENGETSDLPVDEPLTLFPENDGDEESVEEIQTEVEADNTSETESVDENQVEGESSEENAVQNELDSEQENETERSLVFPYRNIDGVQPDDPNSELLPPIDYNSIDFDADMSTVSGKRAVFVRNIAAIRIMKDLEKTNRESMPEEIRVLQSYSGFGGMPEVFDAFNNSWSKEFHALQLELYTEEYDAARQSTLNAHFTPDNIVQSIYEGLYSLGFENGHILEPSAGSGKFFLNMPQDMREKSNLFGIELDDLTARITAKAYRDVTMSNEPFEKNNYADGSFDLAISNVPFGDYRITSDNRYRGKRLFIHDYFINRMIDEVRPGGLVVAITSKGTLDKDTDTAREEIVKKAELVTAIRLPDDTFKSAGTSVTTDILVFKKRETPLTQEEVKNYKDNMYSRNDDWVYRNAYGEKTKHESINAFLYQNFDNILGKVEKTTTAWGKDLTVKSSPNIDVSARIKEIFASVGKIYEPSKEELPLPVENNVEKDGFVGFTLEDGEITFHRGDGRIEKPELTDKDSKRVLAAVKLRDVTKDLFEAQRNNCSDVILREHQKKLDQAYNEYNRMFGRIYKDRSLKKIFKDDPSYNLLLALEVYNKEGFQRKADVFTKRTISPNITPTHADSPVDALAISLGETGVVDFPYMQQLTGLSYDELRQELEFTSIFQDTDGSFYPNDEFLSGNIRKKIAKTEKALEEVYLEEKELYSKTAGEDWKKPFVYNITSPYEQYLQDRIDKALEHGGKFVSDEEGRLDLAPDPDTRDYISDKLKEKNNRDFLLFFAGAAGNLRRTREIAEYAKKDPLFVLDALKYKVSANYEYAYDGNLGVVSECLRVMGLDQNKILERIYHAGFNGDDHEWYSFLRDKFSKENPFTETEALEKDFADKVNERANFFENLKNDWEVYKSEYDAKYKKLAEQTFPDEMKGIAKKREWLEKNLAALKEVCPEDVPIESIKVGLGTTFIPPRVIKEFLVEALEINYFEADQLEVFFEPYTSEWKIEGKNIEDNVKVWQTYGTSKMNALALAEKALNFRSPRVYKEIEVIEDGETKIKKVADTEETLKVQLKQEELKKLFVDWIYGKEEYRNAIFTYYNEHFNAIRPREYNGDMLKFPRMNPSITLKPHQKDAIAHTLFGGNTLLAHTVGAGKTYEMVASAMESKRLGLCNKPLIVVPKHLTEQTGREFLDLYPDANILIATNKDFTAENRKAFAAKIATQNWDAVIMGFTQFERIPITPERKLALYDQMVNELIEAKEKASGNTFSVKTLAKQIRLCEEKIHKLQGDKPKDGTIFFEDLGIDRLYVDEAHYYKNLWSYSKMRNVAGINPSNHAEKSQDLYEKIQYIQEINNGKGVIFATGTPISNSMTELYTMQKYLQPEVLKDEGIFNFDAWASTFGQTTTGMEIAPEGKGFREKTRFSKFHNVPELMAMFKEIADIKTADVLNLPVPECEYVIEEIERSEAQKEMVDNLADRAIAVRERKVKPDQDNMLNITNEGRDLALDERNIDPTLPEPADSKVKRCVNNVLQVYKESEEFKGTQIIFCDRSTPKKDGTFSVYDDVRKKLIAGGVKAEEIEFVQDADTDEKKDALFEKVRKGEVRVLLGGTKNLGIGTNVQDLLIATHDLDVPWTPADLEQRKGRIVRVGNKNPKVKVFRYVTKGTFDSYMWQLIENKQRFISQIMTSKTPSRETEDCDELVLSAAEIKALSAGDPLIREVMDVNNELTRLKIAKSGYLSNQEHTRKLVTTDYPIRIKNTKQELSKTLTDKELFDKNSKVIEGVEDFSITINKKTYLDKKEGLEALKEALKAGNKLKFSGEYKGFKLSVVFGDGSSGLFSAPKLACSHMNTYYCDLYSSPAEQLKGIERIGQTINKEALTLTTKLEQLNHNLEVAKEELGKPFPQEARFKELENRSNEIMEILAAKDKGFENEEDIAREVRMSRIRKIADNPELLPDDKIARDYLVEAATLYNEHGEDSVIDFLEDSNMLETMVLKYNHRAKDVADVLEKYSPTLPSVTLLQNLAKSYRTLTANPQPKIAAFAM